MAGFAACMFQLARFESGTPFITHAHPRRKRVEPTVSAHGLCKVLPRHEAARADLRPPGTSVCTADGMNSALHNFMPGYELTSSGGRDARKNTCRHYSGARF